MSVLGLPPGLREEYERLNLHQGPLALLSLPVLVFFTIWALWKMSRVVYNVFLHPVSRVPGPWLAKFYGGYMTSAQIQQRRAQRLRELHDIYGPVVRIGPNEVSVSEPSLYREIYGGKATTKTERFYKDTSLTGQHRNIFAIVDKHAHAGRRKMQNHSYSQQTVLQNEPLIAQKADVLVRRIGLAARASPSGNTAEVYELCGLYSLEVIMKCTFNRNYDESPAGDSLTLLKAMETGILASVIRSMFPFISYSLGTRLPGYVGHCFRQMALWQEMTKELAGNFQTNEVAADTNKKFMFTPMLVDDDPSIGRKMTREELLEELMGLMFAGSGTSSTTLTYLIYSLARDQTAQDRLRQELQSCDETVGELQTLSFLTAVIKETMRLYPTIISTLPRVLDSTLLVNSYPLPAGTIVGMQNYVHHRNSMIFPSPDEFLPDRWMRADDSQAKDMNAAFTPFSIGSRNCIGQNLARAELYLATSKIFRHIRLKLNAGMTEDDMVMEDRFAVAPKGRRLLVDVELLE